MARIACSFGTIIEILCDSPFHLGLSYTVLAFGINRPSRADSLLQAQLRDSEA